MAEQGGARPAEHPAVRLVRSRQQAVRLLVHDPELGRRIPAELIVCARRTLVAPAIALEVGVWDDPATVQAPVRFGYLLLDGLLARDVTVAGTTCTELVGVGDLLTPSAVFGDEVLVPHRVSWHVLEPVRVAVLDDATMRRVGAYPGVLTALLDRATRQTARMSVHQALLQLSPAETRLLVLFWHLAERWGHVTPSGIVVRLRLSHQLLGQLVGCQRASVTTALRRIEEAGRVLRRSDGTWLLCGAPPDELAHVRWQRRTTALRA
jgi:CRP/FNR family cyclic AMP-dependent transcriptional regulator